MANKGLIAVLIAVVAAGGIGGYLMVKKPSPSHVIPPSPCPDGQIHVNGTCTPATISLSTPTDDFTTEPDTVKLTATVNTTGGSPISGITVTLMDKTTGKAVGTSTTNSSGQAVFTITLNAIGTFDYDATA